MIPFSPTLPLADSLIFPNWHIALIHFPIALVLTGTAIEVFSFLWRRSSFRTAGRWMLLLGALWLLPATLTGIVALAQAVQEVGGAGEVSWREALANHNLPPDGWRLLVWHSWAMAGATVAILTAVLGWLSLSDSGRRTWGPALWIVHFCGIAALSLGAHWAGEATQYWLVMAPRVDSAITLPTTRPAPSTHPYELLTAAIPPEQLHVLLAGIVIALGLVAIALALRNANVAATVQNAANATQKSDLAVARPAIGAMPLPEPLGASRFFLLAAFGMLITAGIGYWVLADSANQFKPIGLWRLVMDPDTRRRLAHVLTGTLLLILPILMAMVSRWATRQRGTLALLAILYLLAAATQIYLGLLLVWDSPTGGFWFRS